MSRIRRPFRYRNDNTVLILISLNILVYLLELFSRNAPVVFYLAMNPVMVIRQRWVWQFFTYMFVHDPRSVSHLVFNMLALFIFGRQVENHLGSREFLLYYFLTGILAGLFSFAAYLFTGYARVSLMGASGAIFAVQLAFAVLFPSSIIYIWGILPLRAPVLVLGFTALELILMVTGMGGNAAHVTHLAGFIFGWFYFVVRFGINPWWAMRR